MNVEETVLRETRLALLEFASSLRWYQYRARRKVRKVASSEFLLRQLRQELNNANFAGVRVSNATVSQYARSVRARLKLLGVPESSIESFVDEILKLLQYFIDNREAFMDLISWLIALR